MNAVTKSGTNRFHGDAFEFYATLPECPQLFLPAPAQFHQNQFGGTIGGPIGRTTRSFSFRTRELAIASRTRLDGVLPAARQRLHGGSTQWAFPDVNADVNANGSPTASPFPLVVRMEKTYPQARCTRRSSLPVRSRRRISVLPRSN